MHSWYLFLACIIAPSSLNETKVFVTASHQHHGGIQMASEHFRRDTARLNEIEMSSVHDGGTAEDFLQNSASMTNSSSSPVTAGPQEKSQVKLHKYVLDEIPGVDPSKIKAKMYSLLGTLKDNPRVAIQALISGEVPRTYVRNYKNHGESEWKQIYEREIGNKDTYENPVTRLREARIRRENPAVMYLPINQQQADPCATPKGSKLMEALPLVFLSTVLSVADAVGNIINNINSNNNNNNNNNDNNINNDNTNLAANINNANQINIVPFGGRALRIARAIMNSIGKMAIGFYETIVPFSGAKQNEDINTASTTTIYSSQNTVMPVHSELQSESEESSMIIGKGKFIRT